MLTKTISQKKNSKPPCLNCTDREVGCHGKCERYAEWKELNTRPYEPQVYSEYMLEKFNK